MKQKPSQSEFLSTADVAAELSLTVRRIQAMLKVGAFVGAKKFGRDWMIPRESLAAVRVYGKAGRPKGDNSNGK